MSEHFLNQFKDTFEAIIVAAKEGRLAMKECRERGRKRRTPMLVICFPEGEGARMLPVAIIGLSQHLVKHYQPK